MRHLCASAVIVLILGVGQMPASAQPASSGAQAYMGVGSCSAPQCHGSVSPLTTSKAGVRQNEYTHWVSLEKHSKAYEVLLRERSLVMAKNLKMAEAPAQSEKCLVCHAMYASLVHFHRRICAMEPPMVCSDYETTSLCPTLDR